MADCTTKRKSGAPGGQHQASAQPGGTTSGQQSSFLQSFRLGEGPASHGSGKGAQQGARSITPTRAVSSSNGQQVRTTASGGRGARSSVACPKD